MTDTARVRHDDGDVAQSPQQRLGDFGADEVLSILLLSAIPGGGYAQG